MSISDIIKQEDNNTGQVILHAEGIFWRAYEKSAYAFATQVASMLIQKKPYKVLGGREVCYLGFPMSAADKYLDDLTLTEETEKERRYNAKENIDSEEYQTWHDGISIRQKDKSPDVPIGKKQEQQALDRIRDFDILTSTPLDAFNLIVNIKQLMSKRDG